MQDNKDNALNRICNLDLFFQVAGEYLSYQKVCDILLRKAWENVLL